MLFIDNEEVLEVHKTDAEGRVARWRWKGTNEQG